MLPEELAKMQIPLELQYQVNGQSDRIFSIAFNTNGLILAVGHRDCIILWDVLFATKCATLHNLRSRGSVANWALCFSPNGKYFTSGSDDESILIWNSLTGVCEGELTGHLGAVKAITFDSDGENIYSASDDRMIRRWNFLTRECLWIFRGHEEVVSSLVLCGKNTLISGSRDHYMKFWDVESGECTFTSEEHDGQGSIKLAVLNKNNQALIASGSGGDVLIHDIPTQTKLQKLLGRPTYVITGLSFSVDGKVLASGSIDCTIRLWNVDGWDCLQVIRAHRNWVYSLAFCPDGSRLASACETTNILFFKDGGDPSILSRQSEEEQY